MKDQKAFRIFASGTDMGTYEGADKDDVLDAYAANSGYDSFDRLQELHPAEVEIRPATEEEIEEPYV